MNITTEADAWAEEVGRHSAIVLPSQGEKKENVYWDKKKKRLLVLSVTPAGILYITQYSNPQVSLELLYWTVDFQTENAGEVR